MSASELPPLPDFQLPPPAPTAVTPAALQRLHALSHEGLLRLHRTRGIPPRRLPAGQRFAL